MIIKARWLFVITQIAIIFTFIACSPAKKTPLIPGWVSVSYGIDQDYVSLNRGRLADIYDEFVGSLFDDGMTIRNSHWLKPTYGNQDLIWILDYKIGDRRIHAPIAIKEEFSNAYKFEEGLMVVADTDWNYAGYTEKTSISNAVPFSSFIFVCKRNKGISVFYWGEGTAIPAQNNQDIRALLTAISTQC